MGMRAADSRLYGNPPPPTGRHPLSKGGVGYDRPGAFSEPQQPKFSTRLGPSGPDENRHRPLRFSAPGGRHRGKGECPRKWGLGDCDYGRIMRPSEQPPSVFWFLFHVEKELAAGAAKSPTPERNSVKRRAESSRPTTNHCPLRRKELAAGTAKSPRPAVQI